MGPDDESRLESTSNRYTFELGGASSKLQYTSLEEHLSRSSRPPRSVLSSPSRVDGKYVSWYYVLYEYELSYIVWEGAALAAGVLRNGQSTILRVIRGAV